MDVDYLKELVDDLTRRVDWLEKQLFSELDWADRRVRVEPNWYAGKVRRGTVIGYLGNGMVNYRDAEGKTFSACTYQLIFEDNNQ